MTKQTISKKRMAALVPYKKAAQGNKIKLGLFEGKFSFKIKKGFKMTVEEFLNS